MSLSGRKGRFNKIYLGLKIFKKDTTFPCLYSVESDHSVLLWGAAPSHSTHSSGSFSQCCPECRSLQVRGWSISHLRTCWNVLSWIVTSLAPVFPRTQLKPPPAKECFFAVGCCSPSPWCYFVPSPYSFLLWYLSPSLIILIAYLFTGLLALTQSILSLYISVLGHNYSINTHEWLSETSIRNSENLLVPTKQKRHITSPKCKLVANDRN